MIRPGPGAARSPGSMPSGGSVRTPTAPVPEDLRTDRAGPMDGPDRWADEGEGEDAVKLAEALAQRTAAMRQVEQLRARVVGSARYQEGEEPAENAAEVLARTGEVLDELEELIRRINRTNSATRVEGGGTLTDALARRDVLRLRHAVTSAAADAAAGQDQRGSVRQLRSELRMLPALPVAELRSRADLLAKEIREVDTLIQRTNWEIDLIEDGPVGA